MSRIAGTVAALFGISFLGACASVSAEPAPQLLIEDMPLEEVIRVRNPSSSEIGIYYNYNERDGDLQMFFVRFRDRSGQLVAIDGALDGWFTPKIYSSDLYPVGAVPVRELRIPANGAVAFERRLTDIARWVRRGGPAIEGPCEVQVRLTGYLDRDGNRPIEAMADWRPGPCPW